MNSIGQNAGQEPQSGRGYLIVHVTTARGAIPLEGALVHVRNYDEEFSEGRGDVIFTTTTNRDGNTLPIPLAAPPRENSLTSGNSDPYAPYLVEVFLEGYSAQSFFRVPIFDGITAIQPADLIPLQENGQTDSRAPDSERFFESSAPDL